MSNHTNTAFSLLGSTPEQRRYRAVSLSREYVDAEFDKIAAQLQTEQTLQAKMLLRRALARQNKQCIVTIWSASSIHSQPKKRLRE